MQIKWNEEEAFSAADIKKNDNNLAQITEALEKVWDEIESGEGTVTTGMGGLFVQDRKILYSPPPWEEDFPLGIIE